MGGAPSRIDGFDQVVVGRQRSNPDAAAARQLALQTKDKPWAGSEAAVIGMMMDHHCLASMRLEQGRGECPDYQSVPSASPAPFLTSFASVTPAADVPVAVGVHTGVEHALSHHAAAKQAAEVGRLLSNMAALANITNTHEQQQEQTSRQEVIETADSMTTPAKRRPPALVSELHAAKPPNADAAETPASSPDGQREWNDDSVHSPVFETPSDAEESSRQMNQIQRKPNTMAGVTCSETRRSASDGFGSTLPKRRTVSTAGRAPRAPRRPMPSTGFPRRLELDCRPRTRRLLYYNHDIAATANLKLRPAALPRAFDFHSSRVATRSRGNAFPKEVALRAGARERRQLFYSGRA